MHRARDSRRRLPCRLFRRHTSGTPGLWVEPGPARRAGDGWVPLRMPRPGEQPIERLLRQGVRVDAQNSHADSSIEHLRYGIRWARRDRQAARQRAGTAKVLTLRRSPGDCEIFARKILQERGKNTAKENLPRKKSEKRKLQEAKKEEPERSFMRKKCELCWRA